MRMWSEDLILISGAVGTQLDFNYELMQRRPLGDVTNRDRRHSLPSAKGAAGCSLKVPARSYQNVRNPACSSSPSYETRAFPLTYFEPCQRERRQTVGFAGDIIAFDEYAQIKPIVHNKARSPLAVHYI
jgi:hypothetical protein